MTNEQLVARIQSGEDEAENMLQLWEQNKNFIAVKAKRFSRYAETEDLQQEGYIALCNAVRNYDQDQGVPFINYVAFWIRQGMQRYIENCCGTIRILVKVQGDIRKYKKVSNEFRKEYGREASDRELCGLLGVNWKKLCQIKKDAQMGQIRSLSEPITGAEGDITLGDVVSSGDDLEENSQQALDAEVMKQDLWLAVDDLPGNLPAVIRCRFLDGKTLQEAGQIVGINKEAVRQQQNKALRTLRWSSRGRKYRGYYEEYISASPVHHVGVESFQRTWTSATEREAIRRAEREEVGRELEELMSYATEIDT